ncbi:hypothetical protein N7524_001729 [Penicillium chrysogenum]|nr:hypothetical protein N7524_001729 [Penicillium chrysogenum]
MSEKTLTPEDEISKAVEAYHQRKKPKIKALAREFGVPYTTLYGRVHGRKNGSQRADDNKALNQMQEKALISWLESLNALALAKIKPSAETGYTASLTDYPPHFNYNTLKPMEKARIDSADLANLALWFRNVSQVFEKHEIQPAEIYNWDETGYQIGQGKKQKVVSTRTHSVVATGGPAESITGIECIAADGWSMLPWFLPKGTNQMEEWFTDTTMSDFRIKPTPSGYIDDITAFEWLCCFQEATKTRVKKDRPRVLFMDNHVSHATIEFTTFCNKHFIIPIWFLPHTTHFAQPLDGEPFQCLKHFFRAENNERVIKLNTKLLTELNAMEENSNRFRKHVQRCMDGSALLAQQLALTERELSKVRAEKTKREAHKNRKTILDASNIALSSAHASRKIKQRLERDTKKLMRLQAKQAKALHDDQQAQLAQEEAEKARIDSLLAENGSGGNWYVDTIGEPRY